jgi:protein-disulfide isomerase
LGREAEPRETIAQELVSETATAAPRPAAPPQGQPDPRATYRVPLTGSEPQKGPDDALITIVAFGDYQCPFCKGMEPVLEQLTAKYGDDLRIVWMNFPLPGHPHARAAATAALEAQAQKGDAAYWKMHDKLFANQQALGRNDLERYAKELGLDMKKFRAALDSDKYAQVIDREIALGNSLGIPGTPSFYMNGRYMAGFPFQTWSYTIDRRLVEYRRLVTSGVPRSALYETLIANGKTSQ